LCGVFGMFGELVGVLHIMLLDSVKWHYDRFCVIFLMSVAGPQVAKAA